MKLKLDLHVHTTRSKDAHNRVEQLASLSKSRGLDGIAITDHNVPVDSLPPGTMAIPGIEISSHQGHVIGLGVMNPIASGMRADHTITEIRRQGGIATIPHPYDLFRPSVRPDRLKIRPDAIEVVNSSSFFHSFAWKRAIEFAKKEGLPAVAGSDSHIPQTLGRAFTIVEAARRDIPSVLDAIRNGSVTPLGKPIRITERVRKLIVTRV